MKKQLIAFLGCTLLVSMLAGCGGGKSAAPPASKPTTKATEVRSNKPGEVKFGNVQAKTQEITGTNVKYKTKVFVAGGGDKLYIAHDLNTEEKNLISAFTVHKGVATLDKAVGDKGVIKLTSSSFGTIAASQNGSLVYMDNGFNILKDGKARNADGEEIKKNKKLTFTLDDVLVSTGKIQSAITDQDKKGDLQFVMAYSKDKALMGIVLDGKVMASDELSDLPQKLREHVFKGGLYELAVDNGEEIYASGKLTEEGNVIIAALGDAAPRLVYDAKLPAIQTWALTDKYVVASDGPINVYLWDKASGTLLGKVANTAICGGAAGRVLQMYASGNTVYFVYLAEKDKAPGKDVPVSIHTLKF